MLARSIENSLYKSKKSILLLGPRQVGKSTLITSLKPDLVINFSDEALYLKYSKNPDTFKREILALDQPQLIALDEIQRLPQLLNTVQFILDQKLGHRFILTGSNARKLKKNEINLLPGRVLLKYLTPLSIWELEENFDFEKAIQRGSLPEVYLDDEEGLEILSSYTQIYLKEEIKQEAIVRNIGNYSRFLEIASMMSGHWINYSKLASDCEIPKESLRRYYSILEETLLAYRIPAYRPQQNHRRVSQREKFIIFDIGVRNAILGQHQYPISITEKGNLFEQWFILQCQYYNQTYNKNWKLSSFRTDTGIEIDLIIETFNKTILIECKLSKTVNSHQLRGLRNFNQFTNKPTEKFIVYHGETIQKFEQGELAIPYLDFLKKFLVSF